MAQIKKIMCAVDFSEMSAKVAAYTQLLARALDASVNVVHVAPSHAPFVGLHGSQSAIEGFLEETVSRAEKTMNSFIKDNFSDTEVTSNILSGYADEEILKFVRDGNVDIIIMGTHGRRGMDRVLFGSVAERVVKTAPIPVLTIRP